MKNTRPAPGKNVILTVALLVALIAGQVSAVTPTNHDFEFVNVADTSQGFSAFSSFPAINDGGEVAFVATGADFVQGVYKWTGGALTPIASSAGDVLSSFGNDVVINAYGIVGFDANVNTGGRSIFTSDGVSTKIIVNTKDQGLIGRFLGSPSINASGTVVFFATRNGFRSQAIFIGDGGALTTVADTANSNFVGFGNTAIDASGKVTFLGFPADGSMGVFVVTPRAAQADENESTFAKPESLIDIVDTNNLDFSSFGDPVINNAGVVADVAFLSNNGLEIFTGNGKGITARTDPASQVFTDSEHPSLNNSGAVAFFARKAGGGSGIFVERTGGASPVALIQTGDTLFGSTVTALDLGRFALNDHLQLAFQYTLMDGRSGVAIATMRREGEGEN
jgi:hypothetical protein